MSDSSRAEAIIPFWHNWYRLLFTGGMVGVLVGLSLIDGVAERQDTLRTVVGVAAVVVGLSAGGFSAFMWYRHLRQRGS